MEGAPLSPVLDQARVPAEFLEKVPLRFAREHALIAIRKDSQSNGTRYWLAAGKPGHEWAADRIAYRLDAEVRLIPAPESEVLSFISQAYHAESKEVQDVAGELAASAGESELNLDAEDVLELDDKAPVVKLVNSMLLQAVKQRASDIHLEPVENGTRVRFRIDGVLYERARLNGETRDGLASRIKVMGRMDIAERRLPQDGGVTIRIGQRRIDLRIASLPSQHGERVVMRLLDKSTGLHSLDKLGLAGNDLERVQKLVGLAHGIILVTGPTGCGKTTTLYAMLSAMNSSELNILTLEDPVEYQLPGITQTQVSEKKGLSFAKGLRALVRQDPDIIMVGEVRDLETASVAIQSALTGHLVLSTLHTNDAPSSVTRLLDLGVEPYLAASSLNAVIAQRLVRQICPHCRISSSLVESSARKEGLSAEEYAWFQKNNITAVSHGQGCDACFNTGFIGRTGIHELMFMSESIRNLVHTRAPASALKKEAIESGMCTLRQNGLLKAALGITTLHEVYHATQMDF